ncbi:unnamed protein product [Rotaria socialis]|uniref:Uncharacterized protein n=1 Tax=Rotaria socialis TaxID=392032 RepID=A0A818X2W1_9BILA|nr:unnamed protein product [Rotaria socialis]
MKSEIILILKEKVLYKNITIGFINRKRRPFANVHQIKCSCWLISIVVLLGAAAIAAMGVGVFVLVLNNTKASSINHSSTTVTTITTDTTTTAATTTTTVSTTTSKAYIYHLIRAQLETHTLTHTIISSFL